MKLLSSLVVLVSFLAVSSAAPFAAHETKAPSVKKFYLKAETVPPGGKYDGFYVGPCHTSAGFNYACLVHYAKFGSLAPAYINDTKLIFDFGKNLDPVEQYPMEFLSEEFSISWGATNINVIYGKDGKTTFPNPATGFRIDSKNHLLQGYDQRGIFKKVGIPNWRVCLWNHGRPELFFNIPYNFNDGHVRTLPPNCNFANLLVEYA